MHPPSHPNDPSLTIVSIPFSDIDNCLYPKSEVVRSNMCAETHETLTKLPQVPKSMTSWPT